MTRAGRHAPRDREIRRRRAATRAARVGADRTAVRAGRAAVRASRARLRGRGWRGRVVGAIVRRRDGTPGGLEDRRRRLGAIGGAVHRHVHGRVHGQAGQHQGARAPEGLDVRGDGHSEARIGAPQAKVGGHRGEVRDDRGVERARREGAAHGAVDRRLQGTSRCRRRGRHPARASSDPARCPAPPARSVNPRTRFPSLPPSRLTAPNRITHPRPRR